MTIKYSLQFTINYKQNCPADYKMQGSYSWKLLFEDAV